MDPQVKSAAGYIKSILAKRKDQPEHVLKAPGSLLIQEVMEY